MQISIIDIDSNLIETTFTAEMRLVAYKDKLDTIVQTTDGFVEKLQSNIDEPIELDFSNFLNNTNTSKFYTYWISRSKLTPAIEIIFNIPTTDSYLAKTTRIVLDLKDNIVYDEKSSSLKFESELENQEITLISKNEQIDFKEMRSNFLNKEREYIVAKQEYETILKSSTANVVMPQQESYYPSEFKSVITRALEFKHGTLDPAKIFTTDAKLENESKLIDMLIKTITRLSSLYPDITIDDGEGQPYQSEKIIDSDVKQRL